MPRRCRLGGAAEVAATVPAEPTAQVLPPKEAAPLPEAAVEAGHLRGEESRSP